PFPPRSASPFSTLSLHDALPIYFALAVGEELGISGRELRAIRMGALLHDVGKIGIPESILNKPGPLTDDECSVMKRHTVIGADIDRKSVVEGKGVRRRGRRRGT